ncbi:hypothetical protein Pmar_PMAR007989 [Perkinsus marinus ATCC 50983]|uniref:Uncharacterized protein n=1 Tax=Perkinsus marinus (strain ATCC 50983 / TXsc) TaxID=423536 RepID=C5LLK5_PERM5|nr:hypothetical protein Pmar_PMAR007989 [Perkinsus marinus ATCC 50983]EER02388.1 hypothetical protein Pmar_PMAR007989 [Perkinsus marinus ATCC 50983]|eukprot:XP_002769670.1 hypothetical protein Pmar_PMAR007989 [Perkinsus marinus ATCC 50983]
MVSISGASTSPQQRVVEMLGTCYVLRNANPPVYELLQRGSIDPLDPTRHADDINTVRVEAERPLAMAANARRG